MYLDCLNQNRRSTRSMILFLFFLCVFFSPTIICLISFILTNSVYTVTTVQIDHSIGCLHGPDKESDD